MSIQIDISNYEVYAMDYLEGTLDASTLAQFKAFLALNPEIAEELAEMRDFESVSQDVKLDPSFKAGLKVASQTVGDINQENYEEFFVLDIDQELDQASSQNVSSFKEQNPVTQRDYTLYQQSLLKADASIQFPHKAVIKKPVPLWQVERSLVLRVAAVFLGLLGAYTFFNTINEQVYMPRPEINYFEALEQLQHDQINNKTKEIEDAVVAEVQVKQVSSVAQAAQISREAVEPIASISQLTTISLNSENQIASIEERAIEEYTPTIAEWPEEQVMASHTSPQELNLAQFVGKQLGMQPERVPTTKALIREGAITAIDHSELVSLSASAPTEEKKTIQFLAGNFEFKRVRYKK